MDSTNNRILRCENCGQLNRIPETKFSARAAPRCGKCKKSLSLEPHPAQVTDRNFNELVNAPIPLLLDLWAPWCGPCHALAPTIEQISREFAGQILVGKLNTDENASTAARFQIRGIPTVIFFRDGREFSRLVGVQPKTEIVRQIQALLQS